MLSPTPHKTDNVSGLLWAFGAVVTASMMTLAIRGASSELASPMIVLARFSATMVLVGIVIGIMPSLRRQLKFTNKWEHALRGGLIAISTLLGFYAITHIPLATVSVLFFTAPIFATILSVIIHKETIGPRRIGAIVMGFLGAVIILRPGVELNLGMLAALSSSLFFAGALVMSRGLAARDGTLSTFFSANLLTLLITLPVAWPVMEIPTQGATWAWLVALIIFGIMRQFADIQSYRFGEAGVIAPVAYLRLVFLGIAGYLWFDETPDRYTIIGASVIILATFYISQRERQAQRQQAKATSKA